MADCVQLNLVHKPVKKDRENQRKNIKYKKEIKNKKNKKSKKKDNNSTQLLIPINGPLGK